MIKAFKTFIVVSNPEKREMITSQIVTKRGCKTNIDFYKKIDKIEEELENRYPYANIFIGKASSLDALLNIFPEAI